MRFIRAVLVMSLMLFGSVTLGDQVATPPISEDRLLDKRMEKERLLSSSQLTNTLAGKFSNVTNVASCKTYCKNECEQGYRSKVEAEERSYCVKSCPDFCNSMPTGFYCAECSLSHYYFKTYFAMRDIVDEVFDGEVVDGKVYSSLQRVTSTDVKITELTKEFRISDVGFLYHDSCFIDDYNHGVRLARYFEDGFLNSVECAMTSIDNALDFRDDDNNPKHVAPHLMKYLNLLRPEDYNSDKTVLDRPKIFCTDKDIGGYAVATSEVVEDKSLEEYVAKALDRSDLQKETLRHPTMIISSLIMDEDRLVLLGKHEPMHWIGYGHNSSVEIDYAYICEACDSDEEEYVGAKKMCAGPAHLQNDCKFTQSYFRMFAEKLYSDRSPEIKPSGIKADASDEKLMMADDLVLKRILMCEGGK
jgi:hypothetical protein